MVEFPHLYAHLNGEDVESFKEIHKSDGEKGWDPALAKKEVKSWLV